MNKVGSLWGTLAPVAFNGEHGRSIALKIIAGISVSINFQESTICM